MQADIRKQVPKLENPQAQRRKKHFDQLDEMESFASPKRHQKTDEVTGISRSGRVRKKSSKLMDFESPDDIADNKYKRQKAQQLHAQHLLERYEAHRQQVTQSHSSQHGDAPVQRQRKNSGSHIGRVKAEPLSENEGHSSGSYSEDDTAMNEEERYSLESGSDDEVDPLLIDDRETGFRRLEPPGQEAPSQANSLYMLEKCKKKLIIKDGKIIGRMKAQRKDKGKTRFTAYMLWAKEIRHELMKQYPEMDFATISKRLGELWATVPNLEKYNWRRRAKRLASKPSAAIAVKDESVWKMPPPSSKKKFINKIGNGKETKPSPSKKTIQLGVPSVVGNIPVSPPSNRGGKDLVNEPVIGTGMYKVIGMQPVDVAAHLKLLGESLTIIGERLKEHEGQIAVSGSLSVLLDSLLCALGPLICLTQQVPETDGAKPQTLSRMLDNIAYIMPGL
ncbi:HMG box-containing protein 4 isoform X2 [Neodiprion pinetum]|uniref:HMG box-containing protein 4 isoform X2 n=1 Tax=Neodiprion lecontei TaxID=441921 RepID=A0A6J0C5N6_NEOLC|nr:HMG box-containing protein 4 isoform X2 [Neodiprion lecontei]XP_046422025.1 HMG box-containing protein 4 isoform X2 [Neodiprion fabricii]XP_046479544.1 HMG box-containing protein 4 isoform X2 [Neodiprion pinetum]XP_046617845.1 HMG box-containing protein 4 isoform X2 [Neodiprion virginianus]